MEQCVLFTDEWWSYIPSPLHRTQATFRRSKNIGVQMMGVYGPQRLFATRWGGIEGLLGNKTVDTDNKRYNGHSASNS